MSFSRGGVAAAAAVVLVAAVCIRLGFWQLDRLEQRKADNAVTEAGLLAPPAELDSALIESIEGNPEGFVFHRVIAQGTFDHRGDLLLRGRSEAGRPGVHLVSPLVLSKSGAVILVNRGWLPSPDAATADTRPFRLDGPVTVEGVVQLLPATGGESVPLPIQVADTTIASYRRLDQVALGVRHPGLVPFYLQATSAASGPLPVPVALPALDNGPHLGYAIQWFSFALVAVVGFLIVARRRSQVDRAGLRDKR